MSTAEETGQEQSAKSVATAIRALESSYYTEPEIFQRELHSLLASTWQYAGHISQLPNPGDYFAFEIAGESLFSIHGKDGELRCFYNVCMHRAHELVNDQGNCRVLVCPYHAWSYELDGALRGGPNLDSVPALNKSEICLTPVRLEIFHGFIFVNLDPLAKPMDDWFPGVREKLAEYVPTIDTLAPLEFVQVTEQCNWKVSVENYSECYHCARNHPTFASGVIDPKTYNIQVKGHALWHTTVASHLERMTYPVDPQANAHATDYHSWFLWPCFSFQVYPGNVLNTYHWRPVSVDRVEVYRGWYTEEGHESDIIRGLAIQDRDTTVQEDIRLVESVQRGLGSRGYRAGPLVIDPGEGVLSEHSIQALHRWVKEALASN